MKLKDALMYLAKEHAAHLNAEVKTLRLEYTLLTPAGEIVAGRDKYIKKGVK